MHDLELIAIWSGTDPKALAMWLGNCLIFSRWLQADLDIGQLPGSEVAADLFQDTLRREGEDDQGGLRFGRIDLNADPREILLQIEAEDYRMVLLPRRAEALPELEGDLWVTLLQNATRPVVVLPVRTRLPEPPFFDLVVPMSGELKESQALGLALDVAERKSMPVDIVHISPEGCKGDGSLLDDFGDEVQHEYAARIEQLVAKGSPYTSSRRKLRIRKFHHACGDIFKEVYRLCREAAHPLLIVEWAGSLEAEHAATVRRFIERTNLPMVLVRSMPRSKTKLKVGAHFPFNHKPAGAAWHAGNSPAGIQPS